MSSARPRVSERIHVHHVRPLGQRTSGAARVATCFATAWDSPVSRLIDFEPGRNEQPTVGWDPVAGLQEHNIPGTTSSACTSLRALPAHAGRHGKHVLEGGQTSLGPVLLIEADKRVDHNDAMNDDCILDVADYRGKEAAPSRIRIRMLLNCEKNTSHAERGGASGSRLAP